MITHPELVKALAKPGQAILESLTAEGAHLQHMILGLFGEISELVEGAGRNDRKNILEELGDLYWYTQGIAQVLNVSLPTEDAKSMDTNAGIRIMILGGQLADIVKRVTVYQKPGEAARLPGALEAFAVCLDKLAHNWGYSRQECLDANIAKLQVRYNKLTYSDADANARKDKASG
jgi:phosphoribosyl-ATP pyrophosphohydrolase